MKRFFAVFLTLILAMSIKLHAQDLDSTLSLEHKIFGTWEMDYSALVEEAPTGLSTQSYVLTFHCHDLNKPGTPSQPNGCYYEVELNIEKYNVKVNIICDWYIENNLLCWKAVDASFYCEELENMDLNNYLRMLIDAKIKESIEGLKEEMLILKFKVDFKNDNYLVLQPKYYGVREDGKIVLVDCDKERAEYVKQYVEMYGREPENQVEELKFTRTMVLNSTKKGLDVVLSCKDGKYTMNFDEEAYVEILRWDAKNGVVMVGGVDKPEEPGTYMYYIDNEGRRSNLHTVVVENPLQVSLKCFESVSPNDKRIVTQIIPNGQLKTYYTDRYLLLENGGCRILLNDKVQFNVTSNGVDVTNEVELYDGSARISPEHTFTTSGIHEIIAKYGNGFSEAIRVEVMDPVNFTINPKKIVLGEKPQFSVTQNSGTVARCNICSVGIGQYINTPLGAAPKVGTYTYFAVVDDKVVSNTDQIEVVEPDDLILSTNLYYSEKLDRYLTPTNTKFVFNATQGGKNVTAESEFYDTKGIVHNSNYSYGKAGLYTHYATKGVVVSNNVNVEARGKLTLTFNKEDFGEHGAVRLTATQDQNDVTSDTKFFHKSEATGWEWILMASNTDYKPDEKENHYKAVRDEIFESNEVEVVVNKNKNIIPGELVLTVDKKNIVVGESVGFTVTEGGKPINTKIYHQNKVVGNPFVAPTPGMYKFVAVKSNRYSNYVSVVVEPKKQIKLPQIQTPQEVDSLPPKTTKKKPDNYKWQGTYEVTTSHQLIYNQDNTVDYIEKQDTLNVVIAFDQNINKYRVYGLCKSSPEADIIAHISEDDEMFLVGSSFKSSAMWAFVMQGSADKSNNGYRYYTKPSFVLPYVFTMDENGNIKHTPTEFTEGDKEFEFVVLSIFDFDKAKSQLKHRDTSKKPTYPAGKLTFRKISKTFSIPKQQPESLGKSSHTTCESQSNSNFLSIFAPQN